MAYKMKTDLPETLQMTLPEDAQDVYLNAYNGVLGGDLPSGGGELSDESAAHAVAWQAVEREFERSSSDGKWYRRGEAPSEEEMAGSGLIDRIKNLF